MQGKCTSALYLLERQRETLICCCSCLCTRWLVLACALTGDGSRNLGVSGRCSNQLSYQARAISILNFSLLNLYWWWWSIVPVFGVTWNIPNSTEHGMVREAKENSRPARPAPQLLSWRSLAERLVIRWHWAGPGRGLSWPPAGSTVASGSAGVLRRCAAHSLEDLQKTTPVMDPVHALNVTGSCSVLFHVLWPPRPPRMYCLLTKMSTENVTVWPWENDFHKILFFFVA